ncbi:MAG: hypothetical protein M1608_08135, partial [Candidatus Omnitrophica bacterium]|nr:hypothetical protein [Candidatus Omnitrophota bacterium]
MPPWFATSLWTAHYGSLLGQNWNGILNYIGQRAGFVMSRLPTATHFAITVNGGNDFRVASGVDWKRWDGKPRGYEGLLTDTCYALTAYIT